MTEASLAQRVRSACPPWIIGTGAQAAACAVLHDESYYRPFWDETKDLCATFARQLADHEFDTQHGVIGAVLVRVPAGLSAEVWAERLAAQGVLVRTPVGMGEVLGQDFTRVSLPPEQCWSQVVMALCSSRL